MLLYNKPISSSVVASWWRYHCACVFGARIPTSSTHTEFFFIIICSLYSLVNIALDVSMRNNLGTIKSRLLVESRTFDLLCIPNVILSTVKVNKNSHSLW